MVNHRLAHRLTYLKFQTQNQGCSTLGLLHHQYRRSSLYTFVPLNPFEILVIFRVTFRICFYNLINMIIFEFLIY